LMSCKVAPACEAVSNIGGVGSGQWAQKEFRTLKISGHFPPQTPQQAEITAGSPKKITEAQSFCKFWAISVSGL